MNIVIVNDSAFVRGGADRVAFDSACALADNGHRVILFTAFGDDDNVGKNHKLISRVSVGSDWIRQGQHSPGAAIRGIWNFRAARKMREVLSKLDCRDTVVHVHLYSSALTASVLHAAIRQKFATILTLHDYFITCPNGAYFVFPKAELCDRRALSFSCLSCDCDSRKRSHKIWRVARTVLQNPIAGIKDGISAYIAVSGTCAALARRDLPASARIETVPNVVAVERLPPIDAARNKEFVFTGRLETYKGPQLLAKAASELRLPVTFCGSGPAEADLRKIYPEATYLGWVDAKKVIEVLGKARAFVFPSVYRETFGLSAAEALAKGIPVVASRGTAAEEFVQHDENGLLFEHNSPEDLAIQLSKLSDDKLVERLGREAYKRYWKNPLTIGAHVSRLTALYESVLTRNSSFAHVSSASGTLPG